jgi:hypothetical protein
MVNTVFMLKISKLIQTPLNQSVTLNILHRLNSQPTTQFLSHNTIKTPAPRTMTRRSQRSPAWKLGLGMVSWIGLLLCFPLFFASGVHASDVPDYGTVIGIVS